MAVLSLRLYPDPLLKTPSMEVSKITGAIEHDIRNMIESMYALPRCVGLAAPQVGIPLRILVVDVSRHPKTKRHHGLIVLVNPKLLEASGEWLLREGCASVPDYTGNVKRFKKVTVSALNEHGRAVTIEAEGFEAVALQHELDHLNGLLFLDRLTPQDLFRRKSYGK
jgi:peptide deformylase